MHRSFGMTARPRQLSWDEVGKGPTTEEVRNHLGRIYALCHPTANRSQAPTNK